MYMYVNMLFTGCEVCIYRESLCLKSWITCLTAVSHFYSCLMSVYLILFTGDRVVNVTYNMTAKDYVQEAARDNACFKM
jgi:hypothetical protein